MAWRIALAGAAAFTAAAPAAQPEPSPVDASRLQAGDASHVSRRRYVTRRASSTAYCLRGRMADGTRTRPGSVAMNRHPLGTRIQLRGARFEGRRVFVVRDRIGYGSELDLWVSSCSRALAWGRRQVAYRIIR